VSFLRGILTAATLVVLSLLPLPAQPAVDGTVRIPLYFKLDETSHDPEYISNTSALDSLARLIGSMDPARIGKIDLTAYASPEGVREHNIKLSRERARHIRDILCKRYPSLAGKISTHGGGEAWTLLRERVVEDKGLTNWWRRRILHFLDDTTISDDTRKWRLSHWLGYEPTIGDMYKYLKRKHYPYLRCCFVLVIHEKQAGDGAAAETASRADSAAVAAPVTADQPENQEETARKDAAGQDQAAAGQDQAASGQDTAAAGQDQATVGQDQSAAGQDQAGLEEAAAGLRRPFIPVLGLSTNLPYDITYVPGYGMPSIPSFSLEYYPYPAGRWTFGADVEWPMWKHWDTHRFMQINNLTLWARRYFHKAEDNRYKGLYLFGNVNAARFGIGYDEKGWEGEGAGASLGIGHKWVLGKSRFFIDAGLAAGGFFAAYDSYTYGNDAFRWYYYDYTGKVEDFKPRSKRWLWMGPTRVYISVGIDLFDRNRKK
jgi:hypothetical protein